MYAFQKKSTKGITTPKREIDLIRKRLAIAVAEQHHKEKRKRHGEEVPQHNVEPSGERELTQAQAGKVLGIKQPNVSRLMRGSSGSYSVDRLIEFLTALGQDVAVVIKPTLRKHGEVSVVVAA